MNHNHFVVVNDWANEFDNGTLIFGVAHSMDEAKEIFNDFVKEEKEYSKEHDWKVYDDYGVVFDAGKDGYYTNNHTKLYIEMV